MSQCLNEQPGELLLKSPLKKKKEKKRKSISLEAKKYRNEYCDFPRRCIQSFHRLYRDRSFIKCTISNPKNHTPAALTHQTKVHVTACSKSNLCLYADISFHRLKQWVRNQHEAV